MERLGFQQQPLELHNGEPTLYGRAVGVSLGSPAGYEQHMTHAATNTSGAGHLRVISGAASSNGDHPSTGSARPAKRKRGPKPGGRRAAALVAGGSPAAGSRWQQGTSYSKQQQMPATDPYAFHCDSSSNKQEYEPSPRGAQRQWATRVHNLAQRQQLQVQAKPPNTSSSEPRNNELKQARAASQQQLEQAASIKQSQSPVVSLSSQHQPGALFETGSGTSMIAHKVAGEPQLASEGLYAGPQNHNTGQPLFGGQQQQYAASNQQQQLQEQQVPLHQHHQQQQPSHYHAVAAGYHQPQQQQPQLYSKHHQQEPTASLQHHRAPPVPQLMRPQRVAAYNAGPAGPQQHHHHQRVRAAQARPLPPGPHFNHRMSGGGGGQVYGVQQQQQQTGAYQHQQFVPEYAPEPQHQQQLMQPTPPNGTSAIHWRPQQQFNSITSASAPMLQQQLNGRQPHMQNQAARMPPQSLMGPSRAANQQQQQFISSNPKPVPTQQTMRHQHPPLQQQQQHYQQPHQMHHQPAEQEMANHLHNHNHQQDFINNQQAPVMQPDRSQQPQSYYPPPPAPASGAALANGQRVLPRRPHQEVAPPAPHLLGNPTPPLTPNAAPSLVSARTAAPLEQHWPPQQQHAIASSTELVQSPPPVAGYCSNATGLNKPVGGPPAGIQSPQQSLMDQQQQGWPLPQQQQHHQQQKRMHQQQYSSPQSHQYHLTGGPHQPTSQVSMGASGAPTTQVNHQQSTDTNLIRPPPVGEAPVRLTLPLRDTPLLGPFVLEHDVQYTSKVFHLDPQLFGPLSKSMNMINPQAASGIKELQLRAYLSKPDTAGHHTHEANLVGQGESLLASNQPSTTNGVDQQLLLNRTCNWPELFQVNINQNVIALDRTKGANKPADVFPFCQPGDNMLEIQVNDCYCSHEFVLEAVDRPTLKAFMNSCFKSRLLAPEACLHKMKFNMGAPGFLIQSHYQISNTSINNEYITDADQTKTKISLRCPISGRRMRTPTRGHNCKHLQCFDLENFLFTNRERSQWSCPLCSLPIQFNMLEIDQHQMNIVQALVEISTDEVLLDNSGLWQTYYNHMSMNHGSSVGVTSGVSMKPVTGSYQTSGPLASSPNHQQQMHVLPIRPQSVSNMPRAANNNNNLSPQWEHNGSSAPSQHTSPQEMANFSGAPVRRAASAMSQMPGRRSATGSPQTKKLFAGASYPQGSIQTPSTSGNTSFQQSPYFSNNNTSSDSNSTSTFNDNLDNLSPLAAMERAIVQHEQQMGPPPFEPSTLTSSSTVQVQRASQQPSNSHSSYASSSTSPSSSQSTQSLPPPVRPNTLHQASPQDGGRLSSSSFSPAQHSISSPAGRTPVGNGSPLARLSQQTGELPPQSPVTNQPQTGTVMQPIHTSSTSFSGTSIMIQGGPETPATPGSSGSQMQQINSQHHCSGPNSVPSMGGSHNSAPPTGVDHQPLSNGSASAGSITSSSTMTPSTQSLGSVGMGGDSRCGTAPLQSQPGLDDLISISANSAQGSSLQVGKHSQMGSQMLDEKNEILMGKLMMDSHESLLGDHRNGDLALALEEAEWKQQLDQGKSEHLANFLNEPLMSKQVPTQQEKLGANTYNKSGGAEDIGNKMLSGGLHPSDDEGNQSHTSSPATNHLEQVEYASYLDADVTDNAAGLPPDDSILDLFER